MKRYFRVIDGEVTYFCIATSCEDAIQKATKAVKEGNWIAVDLSACGKVQYRQAQGSI